MHRIMPNIVAPVGLMMFVTSALAQPASDHLACYLVKDPVRKGTSTVAITNAGVTQSCTIASRAQLGCFGTQASDVAPAPPGSGLNRATSAISSATGSSAPSPSRPQNR